jgi:hypothetical protein
MKMNLGDLVSLEEAGQSQEAASRYQKQLSMLQSGPLGAFAKSSDEAERFIDAMKKSDEGKFEGLQSAAISLRDSYRAGKDRQTKTTSFQDKVESGMSDLRVQAQVIAYNTSQYLKGQDSKGETLLGEKGRMVAYERALKESGAISSVKTELGAPYNVTNAEGNARQSQRDTIRYLDALTRSTNIFAQSLREQHVKNAASLGIKDAGALSQLEIDKEIKEIEKKKKDKSLDEKAKKQLEAQLEELKYLSKNEAESSVDDAIKTYQDPKVAIKNALNTAANLPTARERSQPAPHTGDMGGSTAEPIANRVHIKCDVCNQMQSDALKIVRGQHTSTASPIK